VADELGREARAGTTGQTGVVIPPATSYSRSISQPAAKLTVQLYQLQRGAFGNIAIAHDRIAYGPGAEITVNTLVDPLAPVALPRTRELLCSCAR
jgi:hypothetical protein